MGIYILTSMFANGFPAEIARIFDQIILSRKKFVFVASEFEKMYEKTDRYAKWFMDIFHKIDIWFDEVCVVDGRMTAIEAQNAVRDADVIWLSGGDTLAQFTYLQKYGLDLIIHEHNGIIIGMSAGSINLGKTAICTKTCGHHRQKIYNGLGCVNIIVEPHFSMKKDINELLELSYQYEIYGLCDEGMIVSIDDEIMCYGEVYKIHNGQIEVQCF